MKALILVKRYAHGLVDACRSEAEFNQVLAELKEVSRLFEAHHELKTVLLSPLLPHSKKKQIVEEIVAKFHLLPKVKRFLLLLNEHQRFPLLSELVAILPYTWREKKGIVVFEVRSAVPLNEEETKELQQRLEQLEAAPVHLDLVIDPEVLAGLRLKKGNIVYDASIKGQLGKLREILSEA